MISKELQLGKAGEYLVCADLILNGFVAYLSEQGLPYDVVMDYNGRLLKIQVKTTRGLLNMQQRKVPSQSYIFNIRRHGKNNKARITCDTCDLFALVALDTRVIAYMPNKNVRDTMNFRSRNVAYRVKNAGKYMDDFTLQKCLNDLTS